MGKKRFFRDELAEDDLSIYSSSIRDEMLCDDEISPFEEAFMNGYESV